MIERTSNGPAFQVRARMNRRVPRDVYGTKMNILVGTSGSDASPEAFGDRDRHCHAAAIGNDVKGGDPTLENAQAGTTVSFRVRIPGQAQIVRRVSLKSKSAATAAFAALGCGSR